MSLLRRHNVLPGFGLSLGFTVFYLSLIVLLPLSTLFWKSSGLGWAGFWSAVTAPRVVASYRLTFGASLAGAHLYYALVIVLLTKRHQWGQSFCE